MRDFLTALLECSFTMSVLILGMIVLTPWLSKRYTAKWLYYAWTVIVVGLIYPFRPHPDQALISIDTGPSYIPDPVTENTSNTLVTTLQTVPYQGVMKISRYQILGWIWIVGVISFLLYYGLKHYRFRRMVKRWSEDVNNSQILDILEKSKRATGIKKHVKLKACPLITSPMMLGFLKPVILLPIMNYSDIELSYILKHELIHYKRKDIWYKSLVILATAIHWFNPVIFLMAKVIDLYCEISCDAEVIKETGIESREKYTMTILEAMKGQSRLRTAFSTNFYGGKKGMKRRIFSIMDTTRKKAGFAVMGLILIGTLGTGMVFASNKDEEPVAYSTNKTLSTQEEEKLEREKRKTIAEEYAVYEKYGLTYDQNTDSFYYDGKLVRWFSDKLDSNCTYNAITNKKGTIDLKGVRDADYKLVGIEEVSQEEYDKHTEYFNRVKSTDDAVESSVSVSAVISVSDIMDGNVNDTLGGIAIEYSEEDPNYEDSPLISYQHYGISYNKTNNVWTFQNNPIHYFNDENHFTYVDNSDYATKNGVSLEVIRNSEGKIEKLEELDVR